MHAGATQSQVDGNESHGAVEMRIGVSFVARLGVLLGWRGVASMCRPWRRNLACHDAQRYVRVDLRRDGNSLSTFLGLGVTLIDGCGPRIPFGCWSGFQRSKVGSFHG